MYYQYFLNLCKKNISNELKMGFKKGQRYPYRKKICLDIISKVGAISVKDMGKVMGELKKTHSDEIDFAKAGPIIKELLSNS